MKPGLIIPQDYQPLLETYDTEVSIRRIKTYFQENLAFELNLLRVTAPLFVRSGTGINDDLNGVELPVTFGAKDLDTDVEIVQSLAKWKRLHLADFKYKPGIGIYTDMNAIRPDETLDNLHSLYVDQWDWERVMYPKERNLDFLKDIVRRIYSVIHRTERYVCYLFPVIEPILPERIIFIQSEELEAQYPNLEPSERELAVCREYEAVFVIGIGGALRDGQPHDGRAPDYDDWSTPSGDGYKGLNGDLLVYYPLLDCAYELSSMGIRVDEAALLRQLEIRGNQERKTLLFHRRLLAGELPQCIGGGIGQSRLCMFYLRKAHIGEVQSSLWPEEMVQTCRAHNITLL
ncbi:MAG: aspartate--ammonia ligase [Candidatus Krumholzibacteriia bacterium]